jgi:uncharacterized protein
VGYEGHWIGIFQICARLDLVASTVVTQAREALMRQPEDVVAAYLFGSHARGEARADSDVDVGILLSQALPRTLLGQPFSIEDDLRGLTGLPVQVVILNTAPADLVHRVLRDGVLLLDRDPSMRIRFEVVARNAYFDLKPFLERYRRTA